MHDITMHLHMCLICDQIFLPHYVCKSTPKSFCLQGPNVLPLLSRGPTVVVNALRQMDILNKERNRPNLMYICLIYSKAQNIKILYLTAFH